ncbi:ParB/Sulfiredoxin [uncultured Caudovirales phage]|uniref:ParB/Sulfiredoxin n=1 Tax=uncultured Caudovirales phage TaxID=2100421 RepID=A0A6J5PCY7_9CAUD|nr:ParB/Sulfiredoxin [uncultured Caudovirales phage]
MAEFIPGSASGSLSQMRMQPLPMMSPEQAAAYRTIMLQANATPTESPVTANFEGAYSTGPRGSQLMLNPSVSAKLGDALTVGGGYRTGPMGGVHGRAEIKLPAGLRALLEGSKAGQSAAVAAPVAGGELSATLARMAGQGNMPAQMQGRVGYRIPFANGGGANAEELPPEQNESLIDMATRYGQGVMRKHPIITRGLVSAATDPLDLMQFLAMHGVEPGIVAPNQIETPEQVAARQERASSIPNAGELAQKYLAQAGVRESETLPEQLGEMGISMLGPAMLAKAPKAFSWGAKILGKVSPAKATALTTDAFHGTRHDFPAFVNNPGKFVRGEKDGPFVLDQALGTHFAKDPNVSNTFADDIEGGRIIPAKIPDEKTFLEARQDLLPYITDRSTPRNPSNVYSDQSAIQKMIAAEGYKLRPDLLARYLVQARKLPEDVAASISKRLAKGKSVALKEFDISIGPPKETSEKSPWKTNKEKKVNLERFLDNYGGNPYNSKDRADLVDTARKSWQDKGYTGLKYLNTSPRETEFAKDPTSYIVFDPKHTRSRFAKFNPADVESSDLLKSHGGAVRMGKGGLLKAGAEELTELAAKYLPKAEDAVKEAEDYLIPAQSIKSHSMPKFESSIKREGKNIENVPISWLSKLPGNAFRHSDEKINEMAKSIAENGLSEPLIINVGKNSRTAKLGEGNHRLEALKRAGFTHAPVKVEVGREYGSELGEAASYVDDLIPKVDEYFPSNAKPSEVFKSLKGITKAHGGAVHMGKGGLLKAGAEELTELAAKYLPKANLETDVFHGTTQPDIKVFKPKIRPKEQLGFGTHVTVDPEFASEYAIGDVARRGPSPNVMPLKAKLGNVLDATKIVEEGTPEFVLAQKLAGKKLFTQKNADGIRTAYLQNAIDSTSPKRAQQIIRDAGFDSVKYNAEIKSILSPYGYTKGRSAESYVIFDPEKNLRSKFDLTAPDIGKASGGLSRVNEAGNYTKPEMRKRLFNSIKARAVQGTGAGQWSARKAQLLAKSYKEKGGGYKD